VAGFGAVVLILQWPHVKEDDANGKIKLLISYNKLGHLQNSQPVITLSMGESGAEDKPRVWAVVEA